MILVVQTLEAPLSVLHCKQGVILELRLPPSTCLALGAWLRCALDTIVLCVTLNSFSLGERGYWESSCSILAF